ncbi:acylneuraminate cytidylyltransferase [Amylibacter marinus]|uniref:Acylneuraminate cytidylyltransferase n=1 Tax=Amylibacter marinus TaxID=1475483 RepID=A0ABQ5VU52_9RHOB|nr:acylneuraminate cytidylyltransferase family protein [Amylibacter marinus]GLQ34686.1 acylneuraminate cytidylyltransferase [Amylibacter marinus]
MIIGHIGVRAGSKGLSGKNMREINGKPLLQWSLDQLLDHPQIDCVVVSTDGQDYLDFAVSKGALDIGLRPAYLASDTASKWNVWEHALEAVEQKTGQVADIFVDLDATSPLRIPQDITDAINLYQTQSPDMVMSCTDARKNPYFNLVEPDATGALQVSKPLPNKVVARQQAPVVYEHAASTYVLDPDYLRRASSLFDGRVIPYLMPAGRCFDIDSPEDFEYVEFLMKKRAQA